MEIRAVSRMVRVLVVDAFEPFRRFLRSMLRNRPDVEFVGEVSDGLEAVRKPEELRPDVILLDIGLPSLNGLAAARQIRRLLPKSQIVFVSQESSADVIEAALSIGAVGYVVKTSNPADGMARDQFTIVPETRSLAGEEAMHLTPRKNCGNGRS
ncbi:MAG: response regulator transcription factor [Candidatus Sulfotelmatobacter sp.]